MTPSTTIERLIGIHLTVTDEIEELRRATSGATFPTEDLASAMVKLGQHLETLNKQDKFPQLVETIALRLCEFSLAEIVLEIKIKKSHNGAEANMIIKSEQWHELVKHLCAHRNALISLVSDLFSYFDLFTRKS